MENLLQIIIDILNGFFDLIADIFSGALSFLFNFVITIINITLMPIDALISSLIPDYTVVVSYINDYLNLAASYLGYILDSVGFYSETITLFVAYMLFKLTVPLQIWFVKLAIRWYNALKT